MTATQRETIRQAIDARTRARLVHAPARHYCGRCGCDTDSRTAGCKTCWTRHAGRQKRART